MFITLLNKRNLTQNTNFMFTEPLAGWRNTFALSRRICEDWAKMIKWLLDECYPNNEKVILVWTI